jgi:hypothetical protein
MNRTRLVLVILIVITFSCDEGYLTDCERCYATDVYNVFLEIRYRNPDRIPLNPVITLYEGNVSDSIILRKYYIEEPVSFIKYDAVLYKDYSATLEFYFEGRKYITYASACPKVRYDETTCDQPCDYLYDNIIDLRLRYN